MTKRSTAGKETGGVPRSMSAASVGPKGTTSPVGAKRRKSRSGDGGPVPARTIGLDLGDRTSRYCELDEGGAIVVQGSVPTTKVGLQKVFGGTSSAKTARIAMEVGTHSPWVSRALKEYGHEVLVANPRKLRLIFANCNKGDTVDAESLARVARLDPKLLAVVEHRSEAVAQDLALVRSRDALVRTRTLLVNHVRGALKASGHRAGKCSTRTFSMNVTETLPEQMRDALSPVLVTIELLSAQVREMNARVRELGATKYPETKVLRKVPGVGPLIALVFVLTLQEPGRFKRSRAVGPYLGLVPARDQSGDSDPQLGITKAGDIFLRRLLIQGAQYILGPFCEDCDLRRFGLALATRGGKNGKKRAVVAVARKLAVLLHRLWQTGAEYQPVRGTTSTPARATVAA